MFKKPPLIFTGTTGPKGKPPAFTSTVFTDVVTQFGVKHFTSSLFDTLEGAALPPTCRSHVLFVHFIPCGVDTELPFIRGAPDAQGAQSEEERPILERLGFTKPLQDIIAASQPLTLQQTLLLLIEIDIVRDNPQDVIEFPRPPTDQIETGSFGLFQEYIILYVQKQPDGHYSEVWAPVDPVKVEHKDALGEVTFKEMYAVATAMPPHWKSYLIQTDWQNQLAACMAHSRNITDFLTEFTPALSNEANWSKLWSAFVMVRKDLKNGAEEWTQNFIKEVHATVLDDDEELHIHESDTFQRMASATLSGPETHALEAALQNVRSIAEIKDSDEDSEEEFDEDYYKEHPLPAVNASGDAGDDDVEPAAAATAAPVYGKNSIPSAASFSTAQPSNAMNPFILPASMVRHKSTAAATTTPVFGASFSTAQPPNAVNPYTLPSSLVRHSAPAAVSRPVIPAATSNPFSAKRPIEDVFRFGSPAFMSPPKSVPALSQPGKTTGIRMDSSSSSSDDDEPKKASEMRAAEKAPAARAKPIPAGDRRYYQGHPVYNYNENYDKAARGSASKYIPVDAKTLAKMPWQEKDQYKANQHAAELQRSRNSRAAKTAAKKSGSLQATSVRVNTLVAPGTEEAPVDEDAEADAASDVKAMDEAS